MPLLPTSYRHANGMTYPSQGNDLLSTGGNYLRNVGHIYLLTSGCSFKFDEIHACSSVYMQSLNCGPKTLL
jgi:hypothetical protein